MTIHNMTIGPLVDSIIVDDTVDDFISVNTAGANVIFLADGSIISAPDSEVFLTTLLPWADNELGRWHGASPGAAVFQGSSVFVDDLQNMTGLNDVTMSGDLTNTAGNIVVDAGVIRTDKIGIANGSDDDLLELVSGELDINGDLLVIGSIFGNDIQADPWIGSEGEEISNAIGGQITFTGKGGSDNTDLAFDLDGIRPRIFSPTDATIEITETVVITGTLNVTGGVIENSNIADLTLMTNGVANQLVLDSGGSVGIGGDFEVVGASEFAGNVKIGVAGAATEMLHLERADTNVMRILLENTDTNVEYAASAGLARIFVNGEEILRMNVAGTVFNQSQVDTDFAVRAVASPFALFMEGSSADVSVGTGDFTVVLGDVFVTVGDVIVSAGDVSIGAGSTPDARLEVGTGKQWSNANFGANIVISGIRNNVIGFLDNAGNNPWAIGAKATGLLEFNTMPALGDTGNPPVLRTSISATGDVVLPTGDLTAVLGDVFVEAGFLVLPKASTAGIKVDTAAPTFGWADIIGDQFSNNTGATKPILTTYNGDVKSWEFGVGDEAYMSFHIPHDYVKGTDIFLHIHWSHIGTNVTGGTITFKVSSIYAKGHNQAPFISSPAVGTFVGTASTTQYQHILTETQYSVISSPTGLQLTTGMLEPDGVIEMTFEVDANDIITSGGPAPDPFIHLVDIHYQTTGLIGTKDKAPDFYA